MSDHHAVGGSGSFTPAEAVAAAAAAAASAAAGGRDESKVIFVSNVAPSVKEANLREMFALCGRIVSFKHQWDTVHKAFGYEIEFEKASGAQVASVLNGSDLAGQPVRVDAQRPATPPPVAASDRVKEIGHLNRNAFLCDALGAAERMAAGVDYKQEVQMLEAQKAAAEEAAAARAAAEAAAASADPEVVARTVLVQGFDIRLVESRLIEYFSPCGPITQVRYVPVDGMQCYAMIEYMHGAAADQAIELSGSAVKEAPGVVLHVTRSTTPIPPAARAGEKKTAMSRILAEMEEKKKKKEEAAAEAAAAGSRRRERERDGRDERGEGRRERPGGRRRQRSPSSSGSEVAVLEKGGGGGGGGGNRRLEHDVLPRKDLPAHLHLLLVELVAQRLDHAAVAEVRVRRAKPGAHVVPLVLRPHALHHVEHRAFVRPDPLHSCVQHVGELGGRRRSLPPPLRRGRQRRNRSGRSSVPRRCSRRGRRRCRRRRLQLDAVPGEDAAAGVHLLPSHVLTKHRDDVAAAELRVRRPELPAHRVPLRLRLDAAQHNEDGLLLRAEPLRRTVQVGCVLRGGGELGLLRLRLQLGRRRGAGGGAAVALLDGADAVEDALLLFVVRRGAGGALRGGLGVDGACTLPDRVLLGGTAGRRLDGDGGDGGDGGRGRGACRAGRGGPARRELLLRLRLLLHLKVLRVLQLRLRLRLSLDAWRVLGLLLGLLGDGGVLLRVYHLLLPAGHVLLALLEQLEEAVDVAFAGPRRLRERQDVRLVRVADLLPLHRVRDRRADLQQPPPGVHLLPSHLCPGQPLRVAQTLQRAVRHAARRNLLARHRFAPLDAQHALSKLRVHSPHLHRLQNETPPPVLLHHRRSPCHRLAVKRVQQRGDVRLHVLDLVPQQPLVLLDLRRRRHHRHRLRAQVTGISAATAAAGSARSPLSRLAASAVGTPLLLPRRRVRRRRRRRTPRRHAPVAALALACVLASASEPLRRDQIHVEALQLRQHRRDVDVRGRAGRRAATVRQVGRRLVHVDGQHPRRRRRHRPKRRHHLRELLHTPRHPRRPAVRRQAGDDAHQRVAGLVERGAGDRVGVHAPHGGHVVGRRCRGVLDSDCVSLGVHLRVVATPEACDDFIRDVLARHVPGDGRDGVDGRRHDRRRCSADEHLHQTLPHRDRLRGGEEVVHVQQVEHLVQAVLHQTEQVRVAGLGHAAARAAAAGGTAALAVPCLEGRDEGVAVGGVLRGGEHGVKVLQVRGVVRRVHAPRLAPVREEGARLVLLRQLRLQRVGAVCPLRRQHLCLVHPRRVEPLEEGDELLGQRRPHRLRQPVLLLQRLEQLVLPPAVLREDVVHVPRQLRPTPRVQRVQTLPRGEPAGPPVLPLQRRQQGRDAVRPDRRVHQSRLVPGPLRSVPRVEAAHSLHQVRPVVQPSALVAAPPRGAARLERQHADDVRREPGGDAAEAAAAAAARSLACLLEDGVHQAVVEAAGQRGQGALRDGEVQLHALAAALVPHQLHDVLDRHLQAPRSPRHVLVRLQHPVRQRRLACSPRQQRPAGDEQVCDGAHYSPQLRAHRATDAQHFEGGARVREGGHLRVEGAGAHKLCERLVRGETQLLDKGRLGKVEEDQVGAADDCVAWVLRRVRHDEGCQRVVHGDWPHGDVAEVPAQVVLQLHAVRHAGHGCLPALRAVARQRLHHRQHREQRSQRRLRAELPAALPLLLRDVVLRQREGCTPAEGDGGARARRHQHHAAVRGVGGDGGGQLDAVRLQLGRVCGGRGGGVAADAEEETRGGHDRHLPAVRVHAVQERNLHRRLARRSGQGRQVAEAAQGEEELWGQRAEGGRDGDEGVPPHGDEVGAALRVAHHYATVLGVA
eukprot:Rhum_TRINITY_DN14737_c16_g1::Rhum_TRINITY_DN14737_c16_g1_i3::g.113711::m.113711